MVKRIQDLQGQLVEVTGERDKLRYAQAPVQKAYDPNPDLVKRNQDLEAQLKMVTAERDQLRDASNLKSRYPSKQGKAAKPP